MTTAYWIGPAGAGKPRMSGDYLAPTNWSTGFPPGAFQQALDNAYLPAGAYTVSLDGGVSLASLSIGQGVTFAVADGSAGAIELAQESLNNGTLSFGSDNSATFDADFYNFGSVVVAGDSVRLSGSTIFNTGQIASAGTLSIASDIINDAGATIHASAGLFLSGTVTNSGAIVADHARIGFDPINGNLTNLSGRILTGGSYAALGQADIYVYQAFVFELAGGTDVTLDGAGANIWGVEQGMSRTLDATLARIDSGAALHVLGARDYAGASAIVLDGTLELGGGTFTASQLNARAGALVTGFGTVAARGTIAADIVATETLAFAARTTFTGAISGKGTFAITGADAVLDVTALTVSNVAISATTRVAADLTYAHHLTLSNAILDFGAHQLRLSGETDLVGGTVRGGLLRVVGGDLTSTGHSVLSVDANSTGRIAVTSGELDIAGTLTGRGQLAIGDGATLVFTSTGNVAKAQTVSFADGEGTLRIANAAHFHAGLSAFGAGDAIDLTGVAFAGARVRWIADDDGVGGTLRISGSGRTTNLHIADGHYTRADFTLSDDGVGGTMVTGTQDGVFDSVPGGAFGSHAIGHVDLAMFHELFHPGAATMLV